MNTLDRYHEGGPTSSAAEAFQPSSYERRNNGGDNLYTAALLRVIEDRLQPGKLTEDEALLGYGYKEEVSIISGSEPGGRAPREVKLAVYHSEVSSDLTAIPEWHEDTPDHLRTGWSLNTRELRAAQAWLDSGEITDPETTALLRQIVGEQTDALSLIAVAAVSGGAVTPTETKRAPEAAQQFDLAA